MFMQACWVARGTWLSWKSTLFRAPGGFAKGSGPGERQQEGL